jgi:hypothetical protein
MNTRCSLSALMDCRSSTLASASGNFAKDSLLLMEDRGNLVQGRGPTAKQVSDWGTCLKSVLNCPSMFSISSPFSSSTMPRFSSESGVRDHLGWLQSRHEEKHIFSSSSIRSLVPMLSRDRTSATTSPDLRRSAVSFCLRLDV